MKDNGFTLVELVIIIILLGILSAVAVPKFLDLINPSKENVTKHRMEELKKAIVGNPDMTAAGQYSARGFRGDTGQWPATLSDLGATTMPTSGYTPPLTAWNAYTKKGWNGPYVDASNSSAYSLDAWGNPFTYQTPTYGGAPPRRIISSGANGTLETLAGSSVAVGDDIVLDLNY